MNLIVISELTCNEGLYFRFLTMEAKYELGYSVVVEAEEEETDFYYNLLKTKGWFDFVEDFVKPEWNIDGVRIDNELNYPKTIQTPKITCENVSRILGQVNMFKGI